MIEIDAEEALHWSNVLMVSTGNTTPVQARGMLRRWKSIASRRRRKGQATVDQIQSMGIRVISEKADG